MENNTLIRYDNSQLQKAENTIAITNKLLGKNNLNSQHSQLNPNDDFDYEIFNKALKLTAFYFKTGIRTFFDFAGIMIEDLGENIVAYLPSLYALNKAPHYNTPEFDNFETVDYYMDKINKAENVKELFNERLKTADTLNLNPEMKLHNLVLKAKVWAAMNPVFSADPKPIQNESNNSKHEI